MAAPTSSIKRQRESGTNNPQTKTLTENKTKKRKWKQDASRYRTFIGNKEEGQGYADKRKKKIMYQYKKLKHKEKREQQRQTQKLTTSGAQEREPGLQDSTSSPGSKKGQYSQIQHTHRKKLNPFTKEQKEFQKKRAERQRHREEVQKNKEDSEKALQEYHRKKKETNKQMSKKTRRGQPIMQYRIEHLLEKIKTQTNESS